MQVTEQDQNHIVPISNQQGFSYGILEKIKDTRSKIEQKMHMDHKMGGVDYGDEYYHQGLIYMELIQQQVITLQYWCQNRTQNIPAQHPQKPKESQNILSRTAASIEKMSFDSIGKWCLVFFTIVVTTAAAVSVWVYITTHGIPEQALPKPQIPAGSAPP